MEARIDLRRLLERARQARAARADATQPAPQPPLCAEGRMGCALEIGARVFDTVTGEYGEVIGGNRENIIDPTANRGNG